MITETNLRILIKEMAPQLNIGAYVFVTVPDTDQIPRKDILGEFKEKEGITIILERKTADLLHLTYSYIASWITLKVHSSLHAVGLTAAFSSELAKHQISCNVISGYYHDHIFVAKEDELKAMQVLKDLSDNY
ncbi:ACT domain-containing protein [Aquimarina pacifica]|uniref:ACT domain-containing protein n=1 Tax=Aquimarina pacifica TaxID=1296415 RepID=UPI0004700DC4|nr:ACT domain-containing protein [Aquimarina pacifica]